MPDSTAAARAARWPSLLAAIRCEWERLDLAERDWVVAAVTEIAALQQRLQELVDAAGGANACRDCAGDCCGHGTFHLTLANVLAHFVQGIELPRPDFSRSCPWMGGAGCAFSPAVRPFNCITFNCESIDTRLPESEVVFIESRLRELYTGFDNRYHGSSLRGLLNRPADWSGPYLARRAS